MRRPVQRSIETLAIRRSRGLRFWVLVVAMSVGLNVLQACASRQIDLRAATPRDSVEAVRLAEVELNKRYSEPTQYVVTRFEWRFGGYFISLIPVPPADEDIALAGGGGLLFVSHDGRAVLIDIYR